MSQNISIGAELYGYIQRGIAGMEIDGSGHLKVTMTDGEVIDLGRVVGSDGADGADGANGADGADGADGVDGADGESVYDFALHNGFEGSEETFAEYLLSRASSSDVASLASLVPSAASSQNQLADRKFVTDTVSSELAGVAALIASL
ncbi:MAG: hypothetical protein IKN38_10640 [Clostridia bacterium]|nr:hypothetical protein [Clostridia bacterium]